MRVEKKNSEQYSIDLIDKSWQQMSVMLDQEMPVQTKKRRWVLWLWLLIGVLIGVAASYIWRSDSTNKSPFEISKEQIVTSPSSVIKKHRTKQSEETPQDGQINNRIQDKTKTMEVSSSDAVIENEIAQQNITKSTNEKSKVAVADHVPTKDAAVTSVSETFPTTAVSLLKINSINSIPFSKHPEPIASALIKQQRWNYGITLGATHLLSEEYYLNVGGFLTYRLNKRWKLQGGGSYLSKINQSLNQDDAVLLEREDNIVGPAAEFNSDSVTTQIADQYVQIPVVISYQLSNRLTLSSSLVANLPIGQENADVLNGRLGTSSSVTTQAASSNLLWRIGAAYQINQRLGVSVDYSNSFDNEKLQYLSFNINCLLRK